MKTLFYTLALAILFTACKGEVSGSDSSSDSNSTSVKATQNKKEHFVKMTLSDGPLRGTHTFKRKSGDYMANIAVTDEGDYININAGTLYNESGVRLDYINRMFTGGISLGTHPAYETDCGGINFHDRDNSTADYQRIRINFSDCTETTLTDVTDWKDSAPYRQRGIAGHFTDYADVELTDDGGGTAKYKMKVEVSFSAMQRELVKN